MCKLNCIKKKKKKKKKKVGFTDGSMTLSLRLALYVFSD